MNKNRFLALILAAATLTGSFPAAASDQFLSTCLQFAESRDKRLLIAKEQIDLAKTRIMRSGRSFLPMVTAQRRFSRGKSYHTYTFDPSTSEKDVVSKPTIEEYEAEDIGIRASLPLYAGGRLRATYNYDRLVLDAARYNYTKNREELFLRIKQSYYELLSLRMEYTALDKAFTDIQALMNKIRVEYKAKAISELDLAEAQNLRDKVDNLLKTAEMNLGLATKRLSFLVNVKSLDDIPVLMPESLAEDVPEISFTLKDCIGFVPANNVDLKISQVQLRMAEQKDRVNKAKVIPKLDLEGSYGQSGEAFVTYPLQLATVWSVMGRLSWTLWGNTVEVLQNNEKTNPAEVIDPATRTESSSYELRVGLFDDLNYVVDAWEGKISYKQAQTEYDDAFKKALLDLEKAYNDYDNSLRNARTLRSEMILKERRLALLRKRNFLDEVPTGQVMEESWKYAETISSYAKALYNNYASIVEMERLTLMPLR